MLNSLLKDDPSGGSVEFRSGVHQDGGDRGYTLAGNVGLRNGERYSEYTPWGFNGAYHYFGLNYSGEASP